jgi:4-carboxymuconolactone decarboxylase
MSACGHTLLLHVFQPRSVMKTLAAAALSLAMLDAAAAEPDLQFSRAGSRPIVPAPAQYFSGEAQVEMLFIPTGPDRASAGSVSFAPGARTAWHTHPLGQTLIVTAGVGRVQRWGGPMETIRTGTWCASLPA